MVTPHDITSVLEAATLNGAALTYIANEDDVAIVGPTQRIEQVIGKSGSIRLQFPQAFRVDLLRYACNQSLRCFEANFTQLILEVLGNVALVEGGPNLNQLMFPHAPDKTNTRRDQRIVVDVETAIDEVRLGRPILLIDAEGEGEGDVCIPAEMVTPQIINFMASACRGIICQPITLAMAKRLDLSPLVENGSPMFTITVDAADVGSGTSAYDRAKTALTIIRPDAKPDDLRRPGHMFPLIARPGGVLERPGHTEASSDLARLAGFVPSAVICEVMAEDGHMAGPDALMEFAAKHNMKALMVHDLIAYRQQHEVDRHIHPSTNIIEKSRNGKQGSVEPSLSRHSIGALMR